MTDELGQKKISRRTVAKGAAWSVPVVAVAAAAPAHAASGPTAGDVMVSASCVGVNVLDLITLGYPQFTINAVNQGIDAGSTFTLSNDKVAGAGLKLLTGSDDVTLTIIDGSSATVKLTNAVPAGGSVTFEVGGSGSHDGIAVAANVLATFELAVDHISGNDNTNTTDDSATVGLTGVGVTLPLVGSVTLGVCA